MSFEGPVPCDIREPQSQFDDAVCRMFDDPEGDYEILDRNMFNDPFEADIRLMDRDEWVFQVLCFYVEERPSDDVIEIYPTTFGMRKWVRDNDENPTFLALGVGGTPQHPELLYFSRFFNFPRMRFDLKEGMGLSINWMRSDFFDKVIKDDFQRMYSPN